jgi:hypothetical protein
MVRAIRRGVTLVMMMAFVLGAGCSPAQRRTAGGASAGFGLATATIGAVLLEPCLIAPDRESPYHEREPCRMKARFPEQGAYFMVTGLATLALGGILYVSGSDVRLRKPLPYRFKGDKRNEAGWLREGPPASLHSR